MFNKISFRIVGILALLTPAVAFAQTKDLAYVIRIIIYYLNQILFLLIGLAVVMFVWYVIKYFIKADADRTEAGKYVMYSLIGFFVILSFWGLVNILQNTFGLDNQSNQPSSWTSFRGLFPGGGGSSLNDNYGSGAASGQQWGSGAASGRPQGSGGTNTGILDSSLNNVPSGSVERYKNQ